MHNNSQVLNWSSMVSQTKCSSRTIILQLAVDENYAGSFTFLVQAKYY